MKTTIMSVRMTSSGSGRFLVASMARCEVEETEGKRVNQCMLAEDDDRAATPGQQSKTCQDCTR